MAEEQSLLELNADEKAVKTARLISFMVAFIILKVSMLAERQEAPAAMVLCTGHGHVERWVLSHTALEG